MTTLEPPIVDAPHAPVAQAPTTARKRTRTRRKVPNGEIGTPWYDEARDRWIVRVTLNGKRRSVVAKKQADAVRKAKELCAAPGTVKGLPTKPTVGAWLDHWLAGLEARLDAGDLQRKRSTLDNYAYVIGKLLKPAIGGAQLVALKPHQVEAMVTGMTVHNGSRPASADTRRLALTVLDAALEAAKDNGLVARNVAEKVKVPKARKVERRSLTPAQVEATFAAIEASDDLTQAVLTLLMMTGMRKGEALGLRWSDVDLDGGKVHIMRTLASRPKTGSDARTEDGQQGRLYLSDTTKTEGSRRTVDLNAQAVAALRRWRTTQAAQRLAASVDDLGWGYGFKDAAGAAVDDLVFTGKRGQPLDLKRPNTMLDSITEPLGLGHWKVHELRHTAASVMYSSGVDLAKIGRLLGHSSIRVTFDTYTHLIEGDGRDAVEVLGAVAQGTRPETAQRA